MGAWGCSIFGDDLAMDVKDDYRELTSFLEDDAKIKEMLLQQYKESLSTDDERAVFWYAFALCQWKDGRLEADVKEKAIYYIDHPEGDGNLQLWKDAAEEAQDAREKRVCLKFYEKRKEVLQRLKEQLNSPMPAPKKRKIRTGKPALYKIGDIIRVEVPKNQFAKFRKLHWRYPEELMKKVEPLFDDKHFYMIKTSEKTHTISGLFKGRTEEQYNKVAEYFAIFDWIGKEELSKEEIRKLPVIYKSPTGTDGEIDTDRYDLINRFSFCYYDLFYRDLFGGDLRYLKIGQFRKICNDMTLLNSLDKEETSSSDFFESALWHFATAGERQKPLRYAGIDRVKDRIFLRKKAAEHRGVSIFEDDPARKVRDDYKELTSFLEDDAKVKETLLQRHQESLSMDDERVVFWYAFALCQWKDGRLEADVKEKAIYYIDHPEEDGNLQIWKRAAEEAQDTREKCDFRKFYEERKGVLQRLKEQLNSPMPAPKKREIRVGKPVLYKVGDVVRVEVPKNQFAEFRKLHSGYSEELMKKVEPLFDDNHFYMIRTSEETDPIDRLFDGKTEERYNRVTEHFAIFDWIGKEELSEEEIRKLPVIAKPPTRPTGEINLDWNCSINRFIFCYYELFYRDVGGRDEKYLKIDQIRKVFNNMFLWKSVEEKGIQGGNFFRSALGIRYFESEIGVRFFEAALWYFATKRERQRNTFIN